MKTCWSRQAVQRHRLFGWACLSKASCLYVSLFRDALETYLEKHYVSIFFKGSPCALTVNVHDGSFHILSVNSRLAPKNLLYVPCQHYHLFFPLCRNGHWKSHWVYTPRDHLLQGKLAGHSHSFEEGNVQSFSLKSFSAFLTKDATEGKTLLEILEFIRESDAQFIQSLALSYDTLCESIFKVAAHFQVHADRHPCRIFDESCL
jgi:hypothetical protein